MYLGLVRMEKCFKITVDMCLIEKCSNTEELHNYEL